MMTPTQYKIKRLLDLVFGSIFFILSLLVIIPVGIAIKIADGGPMISKHIRVGQKSQLFVMYKLRTRKVEALTPENWGKVPVEWVTSVPDSFQYDKDTQTLGNVTRLGKVLRKTRIDELPQLWNVAIGNMSIVGPRPEVREIADHYDEEQMKRLSIKPGITGLAQIQGICNMPYGDKVRLDNEYVSQYSIWLDMKILLLTFELPWKTLSQPSHPNEKSIIR
ncbi:sugar transferase [Jeotgalibaca sp. MA1X17-3]|uniref:sugar transferase n=1 Tax=Jeotgalibaca sp. MA1X17-3 TaxID=2908211 RepID=UPI001F21CA87|nr:sugar transferase [Jeotgalibaca sp. MA1X17-3]UJF15386.1 sugar transferase [Jeotgalibaca sp. MA1X17-3]